MLNARQSKKRGFCVFVSLRKAAFERKKEKKKRKE